MESLNNEKPLYFYREHLDNQKDGNPFVIYQRSDGQDIWGVNLFYSHHANRFQFFTKLKELNQSQIPAFLKFHLDKYPGDKTEWIEFVFNSIHNYKRDTEDRIKRNNDPTKKIGYKIDFLLNESPKYNIIIEWLKASTNTQQTNLEGFQSSLTDKQIQTLFSQLKGNYIDLNTNQDHFKAIFKDEPLPPDIRIQWIDKGQTRHEPNKQTIFELFYLLKEYKYLDNFNFDQSPNNPNNFYRKLQKIFPYIKNFPNSNPQTTQKNTPRQKELESIIKSLNS